MALFAKKSDQKSEAKVTSLVQVSIVHLTAFFRSHNTEPKKIAHLLSKLFEQGF